LGSADLADLPPGKIGDLEYLSKVAAERHEISLEKRGRATKTAVAVKSADITKRVIMNVKPEFKVHLDQVVPVSKSLLQEHAPTIPREALERMIAAQANLAQILSTFASLAMTPKREEIQHLLVRLNPKTEEISALDSAHAQFHPGVAEELIPYLADRSFLRPSLTKRILHLADGLERNDPHILKHADAILSSKRELEDKKDQRAYSVMLALALFAARHMIAAHPILSLALGAGAAAGLKTLTGRGEPRVSGFYGVDDTTTGLYNKDWRSRFADMQARPVTVIKTGAAKKVNTDLAKKLYYGVPAIFAASKGLEISQQASQRQPGQVSSFIAHNPEILSAGLIGEHITGKPISSKVSEILASGKRLMKSASVQDLEFLDAAPEDDRELLRDIAILDAATRIHKKLLGG
jgi:hypothetical protein